MGSNRLKADVSLRSGGGREANLHPGARLECGSESNAKASLECGDLSVTIGSTYGDAKIIRFFRGGKAFAIAGCSVSA